MEIIRATVSDAGCWIDGHWGQYGIARMVKIAYGLGYGNDAYLPEVMNEKELIEWAADAETVNLAFQKLQQMGPNGKWFSLCDADADSLIWAADQVEAWLNDNVAPYGHSFGWHDGEFFLQSTEWWEEG